MAHPLPGIDYPESWRELLAWFPDDVACVAYLERLRWPGGFVCPVCGGGQGWRMGDGLLRCAACDRRTSVTAGTIFAGTRSPLSLWFAAAWYITNQKSGVSALGLQRALELGSSKTAWAWLHKFRRAMVRPGRGRLSGEVEVDESYLGGVAPGKHGRGAEKKTPVLIAVEKRGRGIGRVRFARVSDTSADSLLPAIEDLIEPGSVVATDGHAGYNGVAGAASRTTATASTRPATRPMWQCRACTGPGRADSLGEAPRRRSIAASLAAIVTKDTERNSPLPQTGRAQVRLPAPV